MSAMADKSRPKGLKRDWSPSASLVAAVTEHSWPQDVVRDAILAGVDQGFIERTIRSEISIEAARERFLNYRLSGAREPTMTWADVPTERLSRPRPGPRGLRMQDVEVGSYGEVPEEWPSDTTRMRGSHPPSKEAFLNGFSVASKSEVWSDSLRELYEDAVASRWSSAADIPWSTLQPLPPAIEQSICQLMTHWSEESMVVLETTAAWLQRITYGYHEVKLFLGTQVLDLARHTETFRKRALANGGGLGYQRRGGFQRVLHTASTFTEFLLCANVVRSSWFLTLLREAAPAILRNDAERCIYELTVKDIERHVRYGVDHLAWYLDAMPQRRSTVKAWLQRAEFLLAGQIEHDTPGNEALILLLDDRPSAGREKLGAIRRSQITAYSTHLAEGGMERRPEDMVRPLRVIAGLSKKKVRP
jgi:hypothetical protein